MALETNYINPNVILTTRETEQLKNGIKYTHCVGLILVTFFLSKYPFGTALIPTLISAMLWGGVVWYLKRRPTIILNNKDRSIYLAGITKFGKAQVVPGRLIDSVKVMADFEGRARGQYIPQLVLKGLQGQKKKLMINCFEVEDIVQAHYVAQLLATFSRADAFDFKGNELPVLPTHIPSRFMANQNKSLKSVKSSMKKPKGQKQKAAAGV